MTGLNRAVMRNFYRDSSFISVENVIKQSGLHRLFTDTTIIDAHSFEPLGFSLNSLEGDHYSTLHVTPQPECSYVSYETSQIELSQCHDLVKDIINIFKPTQFTVLVVCDSIPFEIEDFGANFLPRGLASHDFKGTGNVLTWYSFVEEDEKSPKTGCRSPSYIRKTMSGVLTLKEQQQQKLKSNSTVVLKEQQQKEDTNILVESKVPF